MKRLTFGQLIVTWLLRKFLRFWYPNVHHRVHRIPPLDPIPSQFILVHKIIPYLCKLSGYIKYTPHRKRFQIEGLCKIKTNVVMQSLQENVFEEFDAIGFEPHIKNG
jgi:hypothetical protein